eukprot:300139-Prorocentrum_minimum.AAC.1
MTRPPLRMMRTIVRTTMRTRMLTRMLTIVRRRMMRGGGRRSARREPLDRRRARAIRRSGGSGVPGSPAGRRPIKVEAPPRAARLAGDPRREGGVPRRDGGVPHPVAAGLRPGIRTNSPARRSLPAVARRRILGHFGRRSRSRSRSKSRDGIGPPPAGATPVPGPLRTIIIVVVIIMVISMIPPPVGRSPRLPSRQLASPDWPPGCRRRLAWRDAAAAAADDDDDDDGPPRDDDDDDDDDEFDSPLWCPLRVYSLSPSAIGVPYGNILSPLPRFAPPPRGSAAASFSARAGLAR